MRIVKRVLSTYSADNFGVCSALYELGGLVVMHDASGCNSTYNTHDEPRWYDTDSLVFVSGLTEKNAIFGNDDVLIRDLVNAANEFHPNFIAVCGGPLPHIIGTDFKAVAKAVERECGIRTFGFQTNGMDSYISGAGQAMEALVGMMEDAGERKKRRKIRVNILGVTPLDFSMNGSDRELKRLLEKEGFEAGSIWAMGDDLQNLLAGSDADVNLVVSAVGYRAAAAMKERFGIPCVIGLPAGRSVTERIFAEIRQKAASDKAYRGAIQKAASNKACGGAIQETLKEPAASQRGEDLRMNPACQEMGIPAGKPEDGHSCDYLIIGEPLMSLSVRETLEERLGGKSVRIISPMHGLPKEFIEWGCMNIEREDALREACRGAWRVIADPLYARLLPDEADKFIPLPHVAYSGRYYENEVPVLIGGKLDDWLDRKFSK